MHRCPGFGLTGRGGYEITRELPFRIREAGREAPHMHETQPLTRERFRRWPAFLAATASLVAVAAPAPAFYWIGWPGSGVQQPPTIISEQVKVEHRPPKPPTDPPGGSVREEPPTPEEVPEPASLGLAAAGLGVLTVRWWRKRQKD